MLDEPSEQALPGTATQDPALISRALGVLMLCGALLVGLKFLATDIEANDTGLYVLGAVALVLGLVSLVWARHARTWTVHAVFALGTAMVCLGIYFSGTETGTYAVFFVWLVIMAASFFSARAIVAHVAWILVATAVTFALVNSSPGVSPFARWAFGSFLLVVAAAMMVRIATGRRAIEVRLRNEIADKARLHGELEYLAHHDPLTGVANRRRFEQELERELLRAVRYDTPLSVAALDLDGFKEYNDLHGHVAGDRLLKHAASVWSGAVRGADMIARIGGDEFVVLLPECKPDEAERVVERMRTGISGGITCSAGIASWDGRESAEELLTRADRAMYDSKKAAASFSRQ